MQFALAVYFSNKLISFIAAATKVLNVGSIFSRVKLKTISLFPLCKGRTDFAITTGPLQNNVIFTEFIATPQTIVFAYNIVTSQSIVSHNLWCCFLEIMLILQPARSDVKIGPVPAHENRQYEIFLLEI